MDVAALVAPILDAVAAEAAEKGVTLETELEPGTTTGDPRLLERLVGNLVENAIRHNVPNGWLRVTTGHTAERVWVHVSNGGAVIPSSDVDTLFEPFRRGGRLRTATRGAGLGLAIVRLIVDAHHGKLQAAAPPFGGLAIRIELPRATTGSPAVESIADVTPAQARRSRLPSATVAVSSTCHGRAPSSASRVRTASVVSSGGSQQIRRMTSEASRFCASTVCSSASAATAARAFARRSAAAGSRSRQRAGGGMPSPPLPVLGGRSVLRQGQRRLDRGEPALGLPSLPRAVERR